MNVVIGVFAVSGLMALAAGGVVAYRWNRSRGDAGNGSKRLEWPVSRTEPDTQAGRI
jgi:ribose/xylose/arabinose/galactoside ABC-type transport system permease subunit